jgi:hypothetical protein
MSATLRRVQMLVALGKVRVSDHGYDELANDGILAQEVLAGLDAYRDRGLQERDRGPSILTLQQVAKGLPIHAVWGIPKTGDAVAVLVTAYRPDPARWDPSFTGRKKI